MTPSKTFSFLLARSGGDYDRARELFLEYARALFFEMDP
jgi:hypothetical protein